MTNYNSATPATLEKRWKKVYDDKNPTLAGNTKRRIAIFMDGVVHAALLPFGPVLIGRLLFSLHHPFDVHPNIEETSVKLSLTDSWSAVAWQTATLVAMCIAGHAIGAAVGQRSLWVQRKLDTRKYFFRAVALVVALHFVSFGSGMTSTRSLLLTRTLSYMIAGLLNQVATTIWNKKSEVGSNSHLNYWMQNEEMSLHLIENLDVTARNLDLSSGKVWLTGFTVSVLTNGLLYRTLSQSVVFGALTGNYPFTLSPLFFFALVWGVEVVLFSFIGCVPPEDSKVEYEGLVEKQSAAEKKHSRKSVDGKRTDISTSHNHIHQQTECGPVNGSHSSGGNVHDEELEYFDPESQLLYRRSTPTRARFASTTSIVSCNDEFFDCASDFDSTEEGRTLFDIEGFLAGTNGDSSVAMNDNLSVVEAESTNNDSAVAIYAGGKCIYSDGSCACVPAGESPSVPSPAFTHFYKDRALQMWEQTKIWRIEKHVWNIHSTPHTFFPEIKAAYPHFIHGISRSGYPIIYEQPGKMNLKQLFKNGCEVSEMVRHYTFFMEYLSNCVRCRPEVRKALDCRPETESPWGFLVVMDLKGASLSSLSGDVLKYLKQAGDVNSAHYPLSMKRAILVNSPFWLAGAFRSIKGILPESVTVDITSSRTQLSTLRDWIDDDQIPKEYGGSSSYPLGKHPFEVDLEGLVNRINTNVPEHNSLTESSMTVLSSQSQGMLPDKSQQIADSNYQTGHCPRKPTDEDEHNRSERIFGNSKDVGITVNSSAWSTEIASAPSMRRRTLLPDTTNDDKALSTLPVHSEGASKRVGFQKNGSFVADDYVFFVVSMIHFVWSAVQGLLKAALPLWFLSPPSLDGLGYEPARTGVSLFCASVVLMWLTRTKASRIILLIPTIAPMRAFRLGSGAEAFLLLSLPLIPKLSTKDNMLVMTLTVIALSCLFVSGILGRSAVTVLHRAASRSYIEQLSLHCDSATLIGRFLNGLTWEIRAGRITDVLGVVGEVVGAVLVAPIYCWSAHYRESSFPIHGAFVYFTGALVCMILYVFSFSLCVNNDVGEKSALHLSLRCSDTKSSKSVNRCTLFREIFAVSVSDMASLFEEANWTTSSALGLSASNDTTLSRRRGSIVYNNV